MTGALAELLQIEELRSAITVAKGMDVVHISHDRPGGLGKLGQGQAPEEVSPIEPPVDVGHACFDETSELESMAALGNLDRAHFAGPIVDILKEMAVDRPQVDQIEITGRYALVNPLGDKATLDHVEAIGVHKTQLVS